MIKTGSCHTLEIEDSEREFLILSFPFCNNEDLCRQMGCSMTFIHRQARLLHLKKDPVWEAWMRKRAGHRINTIKRIRGTHPPKGFIIPGREKNQFRKGESNKDRWGEERFNQHMQMVHAKRRETLRRDKLRRKFGLSPLTKFRNLGTPQPKKVISWKCSARKRGYEIDDHGKVKVAWFDGATARGARFESNGAAHGFIIQSVELKGAQIGNIWVTSRVEGLAGISFE